MKKSTLALTLAVQISGFCGLGAENGLYIERKLDAMKGISALIDTLPETGSVLPKNLPTFMDGKPSIQTMLFDQQFELAKIKNNLGKKGDVSNTPFMEKAKKSRNPKQQLAYITTQIEELKRKTFNKKLAAFDLKFQLFHKGAMSLNSYIELLTQSKDRPSREKTPLVQTDFYKKLQTMESKMNFEEIDRERMIIVRRLAYRLKGQDQNKLRKMVLAYRLQDVRHKDFYSFIETSCLKSGIKMENYPHIKAYMRYISLADHLDLTAFRREVAALEQNQFATLTRNKLELALVKQTQKSLQIARQIETEEKSISLVSSKN